MSSKKFLRMYSPDFWPKLEEISDVNESADKLELKTIIKDFRTKDNSLSIWNLDNPIDAALGLINPSFKLGDVFFVKITEESLEQAGLKIVNNKGTSIFDNLNDNHFDIIDINYTTLKKVSSIVLEAIRNEQCEIVISQEIVDGVRKALDNGIIDISALPKDLKNNISNDKI